MMAEPTPSTLAQACQTAYPNCVDETAYMIAQGYERVAGMRKSVVWVRGDYMIVAHRGTVLPDFEDLACDIAIATVPTSLEGLMPRFLQARINLRALCKRYPHMKVIVTGHSLGGTLALFLGYHCASLIHKCVSFNAYVTVNMWGPNLYYPLRPHKNFYKCDVRFVITDVPIGATGLLFVAREATILGQVYDSLKPGGAHGIRQWY